MQRHVAIDSRGVGVDCLFRSVRYFVSDSIMHRDPTIAVEAGEVIVSVGGGQPGFTEGVLNATLTVSTAGLLNTGFECKG
jgi:hypothetical protein